MTENGITPITEDIVQVQIPLPYALNIVNCYLLQGENGWTMVDSGLNTEPAREQWRVALNHLNITPDDIEQIIITHMHPDHFGMAGWWQSITEPPMPVYYPVGEAKLAEMFFSPEDTGELFDWLVMCGMPEDTARDVTAGMSGTRSLTHPHPLQSAHIVPDQTLQLGARTFRTIHSPGHSDGQLMLYDESDNLLLSGDHVLMKITPNIGKWMQSEQNPLGRFMQSLAELEHLKVRVALPGHKWLIEDWQGRVQELIAHHEVRLEHTCEAIDGGAHTVYEIAHEVFKIFRFTAHEWRFAMAETLAHLELLEIQGKVSYDDERVLRYYII